MQRRLLRQARSMSSPLYAGLLERCADDVVADGPAAKVCADTAPTPPTSLGLRLMAAVHRLVLDGSMAET